MRVRVTATRGRPAPTAGLLLAAAALWLRWSPVPRGLWADLEVYRHGAATVLRGGSLYEVVPGRLSFTYPPFAAVVFVPLQLVGPDASRWGLTALSLGCYVAVVTICARRLGLRPGPALVVAVAGLALEPVARDLLLGQVNLPLMLLVVLDVLVAPRRARGLLVGLAAGIKVVPGAFALYFVLRRDWAALARCAAGFAATLVAGLLAAPGSSWTYWTGGFTDLARFGPDLVVRTDNQSLPAVLMRLAHTTAPPPWAVAVLALAALGLGAVAAARRLARGDDVGALACLAVGSLLASPISWTHHWVWLVVVLLVLTRHHHGPLAAALGLLVFVGPMWLVPLGHLREFQHTWWQAVMAAAYVLAGLVFLALMATRRPSPGQAEPGRAAREDRSLTTADHG